MRPRYLILLAMLTLAAAARIAPPPTGSPHGAATLLYPPDRSVIAAGSARIVTVAPAERRSPGVTLDGKPLKMDRLSFSHTWMLKAIRRGAGAEDRPALLDRREQAALWIAVASLTPGTHVLSVDGARSRIYRAARKEDPGAPAGWPLFHAHPPSAQGAAGAGCSACHSVSAASDGRAMSGAPTPETCYRCHAEADLQLKHNHIMDHLSRCWSCHDPHGSTRPQLLVDTQARLCSGCHETGHAVK
jgi:predicted CXXCH cytochrome family protein